MAKKKNTKKEEVENLSFEQSIESLTEIVENIETGRVSLAESLEQYEKGMAMINHCRNILLDAEKRIEKIADSQDDEEDAEDEQDDDTDDPEDESLF